MQWVGVLGILLAVVQVGDASQDQAVVPLWAAILIGGATATLWAACVAGVGRVLQKKYSGRSEESKILVGVLSVCCFLLVGPLVCVNLAFTVTNHDDHPAIPCDAQHYNVCLPYKCDLDVGLCSEYCNNDGDCHGTMVCDQYHTCVAPGLQHKLLPTYVSVLVVCGVSVFAMTVAVYSGLLVYRLMGKTVFSQVPKKRLKKVLLGSGCVAGASAVGVAAFLFSYTVNYTPSVPGNGLPCDNINDGACSPYYCDVTAQKCYTVCRTDVECIDGSTCSVSTATCTGREPHGASYAGALLTTSIVVAMLAWILVCSFIGWMIGRVSVRKSEKQYLLYVPSDDHSPAAPTASINDGNKSTPGALGEWQILPSEAESEMREALIMERAAHARTKRILEMKKQELEVEAEKVAQLEEREDHLLQQLQEVKPGVVKEVPQEAWNFVSSPANDGDSGDDEASPPPPRRGGLATAPQESFDKSCFETPEVDDR